MSSRGCPLPPKGDSLVFPSPRMQPSSLRPRVVESLATALATAVSLTSITLVDLGWSQSASAQAALDGRKIDTRLNVTGVGTPIGGTAPNGVGSPRGTAGDGRALDRNLQVGSGGINSSASRIDFNSRNAIVTNSVAGGRGFRGSVGYRASDDFRGSTAGDSNFRFRADSALSSSFFLSMRGQDRFNVAQGFGEIEYRRDATPGGRVGPSALNDPFDRALRLDRAAAAISGGRVMEFAAEPVPFATGQDRASRKVEFLTSPVQGLRTRRLDDELEAAQIPTFERARARRDISDGSLQAGRATSAFSSLIGGPGVVAGSGPINAKIDSQPKQAAVADGKIDPNNRGSAYDEIVRKIVDHYGDDPTVHIDANPKAVEKARKDLDALRERLGGRARTQPLDSKAGAKNDKMSTDGKGPAIPLPGDEVDPVTGLPKSPAPELPTTPEGAATNDPAAIEAKENAARTQSVKDAASALRHGTKVGDLSTGDRVRVNELVREGQANLESGDFFRAERCFDQALTLNPDNPMLLAGLANSQIGAGLYLSASLTMRTLFAQSPEMIDTRFEPKLLPNETRMRLAIESLRTRIVKKQDVAGYALTLAYLGHQIGDRALVTEGLKSLTGSMDDDLMRELLTQIWLGEEAPPAEAPKP